MHSDYGMEGTAMNSLIDNPSNFIEGIQHRSSELALVLVSLFLQLQGRVPLISSELCSCSLF